MVLKQNTDTKIIYEAVYNLLEEANTNLPGCVYKNLSTKNYNGKENILKNAYLAQNTKRPLCQDTGQVVIFLEVGQDVIFSGKYIEDETEPFQIAIRINFTENPRLKMQFLIVKTEGTIRLQLFIQK